MPAREEVTSVRFELTEEDLAAFHLKLIERSGSYQRQRWIGMLGLPIAWIAVWCLYVQFTDDPAETSTRLWWLLLYAPIHIVLYPRRWRQGAERLRERLIRDFKKNQLLGKRHVSMTPDEIREKNPMSEVASKWIDVLKTERVDERLFVYLSARAAIIVPKRAFDKPEEFDAFAAKAEGYWAAKA